MYQEGRRRRKEKKFSTHRALEKTFQCLSCGQEIKLECKDNRWLRWNLDGTPHVDERKKSNNNSSTQIANLAKKVETLESKLDTLIAQIQMLRSEIKK